MATSLAKSENKVQIHHLHPRCAHMVKRLRKAVAKGRCYGNQLNLEDVRRHRQEPLLFATAFDNGLADRKSALKRLG